MNSRPRGYEPAGVTTLQAKKKPKGGKLSPEEKEANRRVSKVRVRVEHSSAGVKVFRSVRDIYRNFKTDFDKVSLIYDKIINCIFRNFF